MPATIGRPLKGYSREDKTSCQHSATRARDHRLDWTSLDSLFEVQITVSAPPVTTHSIFECPATSRFSLSFKVRVTVYQGLPRDRIVPLSMHTFSQNKTINLTKLSIAAVSLWPRGVPMVVHQWRCKSITALSGKSFVHTS